MNAVFGSESYVEFMRTEHIKYAIYNILHIYMFSPLKYTIQVVLYL